MATLWTQMLGAEVRFLDIDGIRTRVIVAGEGPALVFLHGSGGHSEAYAHNIVPLSKSLKVIAIDYLGHGLTDYPDKPPTMRDRADHVIGVLDALGVEKACIAGESFGATIGFACVKHHSERVSKLIAIVGGSFEHAGASEAAKYFQGVDGLAGRMRAFLENPSIESVRARLNWLFHKPERDVTDELVETRWRLYQQDSVRRAIADLCVVLDEDTKARARGLSPEERHEIVRPMTESELQSIEQPVLFIWTDHNPTLTIATARKAANMIPNSQFAIVEDCGHWPQWESPAEVNRLIEEFMAPALVAA